MEETLPPGEYIIIVRGDRSKAGLLFLYKMRLHDHKMWKKAEKSGTGDPSEKRQTDVVLPGGRIAFAISIRPGRRPGQAEKRAVFAPVTLD